MLKTVIEKKRDVFDYVLSGRMGIIFGNTDEVLSGGPGTTVLTLDAINITGTSATLKGSVTGWYDLLRFYFEWGETTGYGHTTDQQELSGDGEFTKTITGLTVKTEYHFRAMGTEGI